MPRWVLIIYAALGGVLWMMPLFDILHAPSSALVATVAFFVAGMASIYAFQSPDPPRFWRALGTHEAMLGVPLALLTVSMLWAPNCDYWRGLLFYLLFPGITVVFAVALAYAITGTSWSYPKSTLAAIGGLVIVLGPLYDLGLHPQLYTYNHVFGGVLGPLYDVELAVRTGLFTFRGLTLLWAVGLFLVGTLLRIRARTGSFTGTSRGWYSSAGAGLIALCIGLSYAFAPSLGINTTSNQIQQALGGHHATEHFDIYYDPDDLSSEEVERLANKHEYRYAGLQERAQMDGPERVASYLYPDPNTKGALTGSRHTSLAPVWLPDPQIHMLRENVSRSFAHELAHVFSRDIGLPLINASWAVGLVEGWAVALEPPDGRPSSHEQVAVSVWSQDAPIGEELSDEVAARLSPWGFWTGRGAVSYTMLGSFVRYLLDTYGAGPLKEVYARANFEEVYGRPIEALADEWQQEIMSLPHVDRSSEDLVARRFTRPSLFEVDCPFYIPPHRRALREGREAANAGDTLQAYEQFERALTEQPHYAAAHNELAKLRLADGAADAVVEQLDTLDTDVRTPALNLRLGDAHALEGNLEQAREAYETARRDRPHYDHGGRAQLGLRLLIRDRPNVLRILVSAAPASEQANQLADQAGEQDPASPAVQAWAALRHMEAQEWTAAGARWNQFMAASEAASAEFSSVRRQEVRRAAHIWHAEAALHAGTYDQAYAAAQSAVEQFRAVGADNAAARARDLLGRIEWSSARAGSEVE